MEQNLQEAVNLIGEGQCEDALARLDRISSDRLTAGDRLDFLYWRGFALFNLNRFAEAEQIFRQAICECPEEGRFYRSLGQLLSEGGREEESLGHFAKAREFLPQDCLNAYEWGYALYKLERDADAISRFEEATEIDPKCSAAVRYLGEIHSSRGDYGKALEAYQRYLERVSGDYAILVEAAICLSDLERFEEAFDLYRRAAAANAKYVYTYYNWSVSLWRAGELDQAKAKTEESIGIEEQFPLAWMLLGRLELALGHEERAIEILGRGIGLARQPIHNDVEMVSWCYETYFDSMIELRRPEDAQVVFWEAARANLLTQVMLEHYNTLSHDERSDLSLWWVLLDVRLFEPEPVDEADGGSFAGYLCGFNVLARDPDEAVDYAVEFEKHLGEGDAVVEECLLQEQKVTAVPGVCWVYPNRNYYGSRYDER